MLALVIAGSARADDDAPERLTEAMLKAAAEARDAALNRRDLKGAMADVAEHAQIIMADGEDPSFPMVVYARDTYAELLRELWEEAVKVTLERRDVRYRIAPDGQTAVVTSQVVQSTTLREGGGAVRTRSEQVAYVRLIGGRPMLERIEVRMFHD